jgi:transcriptional regulator with XRE-family HTH domain
MDLNPVLTPVRDIGEFIREQRTSAQISVRALAAKAGVSNPYLSQIERGLRRPSAEILTQIAHALSISVESLLARAGILETADAPEVIRAIHADGVLTERHKAVLVDIYAAFRKEAVAVASGTPAGDGPPTAEQPTSTGADQQAPTPEPTAAPDARTGDQSQ